MTRLNPIKTEPERYCEWFAYIPLPRSLQVIRAGGSHFQFGNTKWRNRTFCFKPNNLTFLDASHSSFFFNKDSSLVFGFDKLETLGLAHRCWGYFFHDPTFLHTMPSLQILNLTSTNVGVYIQNDTDNQVFEMSTNLRELLLRSAQVTSIPLNEFRNLPRLEILDLSDNGLTQISFSVSSFVSLSLLNVSSNSLYYLAENMTKDLDNLYVFNPLPFHVDLQGISFICDCPSLSFIRWIKNTDVKLTSKSKFLCNYQGNQEMTLVAVNINNLIMDCYLIYIVTSTLAGIAIVIISTFVLVYKYRWKIRALLIKLAHWRCDDVQCNYDAFVVYSEDRQWVHNILLPEIETVRGMKLCVHFRDFNPGDDIDEQIVRSVDNSRKTLLVLTKHFLVSEWCQNEMRVARNKLQAEGKDVVVPILLAELPEEHGNPSVKNLIREKTYLRWETILGGQEYFWETLAFAIRSKNTKPKAVINQQTARGDTIPCTAYPTTQKSVTFDIAEVNKCEARQC